MAEEERPPPSFEPTGDAHVDAALARLTTLAPEIDHMEATRGVLYAERLAIFRDLTEECGVRQAVIAKASGLGSSGVSFVLHHARKAEAKAAGVVPAKSAGKVKAAEARAKAAG